MLTEDRVVGGLVLVKAADVVARGPGALPGALWAAVLGLWTAAGLALLAGPARTGLLRAGFSTVGAARTCWAAVLVAGTGLAIDAPLDLRRQHLVLLMAVALVGVVAREDQERLLLWRVQLSALYGVAALAKVNESFLGGDVLAGAVVAAPLWSWLLPVPPPALLVGAGIGLIATELGLAVTPWVARLRRPGTVVAACLHGAALLLVSTDPPVALRLVVFGGTAVLLHAASAGLLPATATATATATRPDPDDGISAQGAGRPPAALRGWSA